MEQSLKENWIWYHTKRFKINKKNILVHKGGPVKIKFNIKSYGMLYLWNGTS